MKVVIYTAYLTVTPDDVNLANASNNTTLLPSYQYDRAFWWNFIQKFKLDDL